MSRSISFFCILFFLNLPAHAEEAKPLASLDLDLNRLKTWGTKTYIHEESRLDNEEKTILGSVVLKTELTAKGVLLDDKVKIRDDRNEMSWEMTTHCARDNFLSPTRVESKMTRDNDRDGDGGDFAKTLGNFVATIDGTRATIHAGGSDREMTLPSSVVHSWAFFRIVTLLPRQKGSRISFPNWLEEEFFVKKDFQVECMGRDTVQSSKEDIACTKFRLTGGKIKPMLYWVSDDDVLRQALIDGKRLIRLKDD